MRLGIHRIAVLAITAPLVMGVSDCSNKSPDMGKIVQATPSPPACDRVEYEKPTVEPCLMDNGKEGTSIWTLKCYSDSRRDPATGICVSNGQNEYCNPDPIRHTACATDEKQTLPGTPDNGGGAMPRD